MKTKSGYETDGRYIKFKSGYTVSWCVEIEKGTFYFNNESLADRFITIYSTGSDLWTEKEKEFIMSYTQPKPKWQQ